MKIFSPVNKFCDIHELVKYADEFYLGILNNNNNPKYVNYNTRGNLKEANFSSIEEMAKVVKIINENHKEAFLTLNAHSFSNQEVNDIKETIIKFKAIGGKGIISSDLNIIKITNEVGLKVYLSTIMALYNVEAIKCITSRYKVDRVILSRDVSFSEIKKIKEAIKEEVECFVLYSGCRFSNGNCYCLHIENGGMCKFSLLANWKNNDPLVTSNHQVYSNKLLNHGCGVCAIYDFLKLGIDSVKITGRELPYSAILHACKAIYELREIAKTSISKADYIKKIENYKLPFPADCQNGFDCFYPELGKWRYGELNEND